MTTNTLLFVVIERDDRNNKTPSNAKLKTIAELLSNINIVVDFIFTDKFNENIEGAIRAALLYQFGEDIRNSYVSVENGEAVLWLVPKKVISEEHLNLIKKAIIPNFSTVGLILRSISLTNTANTPSKIAIMSSICTLSLAKIETIRLNLENKGFAVPSIEWLSKMLDNLRKGSFILRGKNEMYTLTLTGLKLLGTVKNSRSPDIKRLLDLARRN